MLVCFCFDTALCGVVMYNYLKSRDIGVSNQLPVENISEKTAKVIISISFVN